MTITRDFAKKQCARFSGRNAPQTGEALKEIENAIMSADSEVQAKAVIDDWIHEHEGWPAPAHVYGALQVIRDRMRLNETPLHKELLCAFCNDTGFRVVSKGEYDGAVRCDHKPANEVAQ
jgi:hypothetical protein